MQNRSRYPGTRPFREEDRHLFFGRDHDKKKLSDLIDLENLVVLFGKSGYGKSSLLNAGVIPYLRHNKHHFPIKIRFMPPDVDSNGAVAKPLEILENHLVTQIGIIKKDLERQNGKSCFLTEKMDVPNQLPNNLTATLWYYIKFIQLTQEITEATTLVFYQFEELFRYYDDAEVDRFGLTMAALLHSNPPDELLGLISQNLNSFTEGELDQLYEPLNLKVVFSVASDHLSLLDKLKRSLPQIFKYSYELKALTELQAQKALEEPAKKDGKFSSPKFTYTDEAIKEILSYLKGKNKEGIELENEDIETFQLQLIGQHAEENIVSKKRNTESNAKLKAKLGKQNVTQYASKFEYTLKDLGDPSNILKKFYKKVIDNLDLFKRKKAKNLIEKGLIIKGNRVALSGSQIKRRYNVYEDTLGKLEDEHLLRSEFKLKEGVSTQSFEISHFNLVKPIQDSVERRKRKRLWILIFILLFLLLITGLLGLWAFFRTPPSSNNDNGFDKLREKENVVVKEEEVSNGLIINAIGTATVLPTRGPAPLDVDFIFTRVDTIGDVHILSYYWDFYNDSTTISNNKSSVRHTYKTPGKYTARLIVTTNDSVHRIRTEEVKIKVDSAISPIVKVTISASPDSGKAPLKVNFKGSLSSPNSALVANRYLWEFNDGDTSTVKNPVHTFRNKGIYNVRLTLWDTRRDVYSDNLIIKVGKDPPSGIAPIAKIKVLGILGIDETTFKVDFDGSGSTDDVAIVKYLWEFNDGGTSPNVSPFHTFEPNRDYDVRLKVWDSDSLTGEVNEIVKIPDLRRPKVVITPSDTIGIAPFKVDFVASNTFTEYIWNFPDSTSSTLANTTHVFDSIGTYNVRLTVIDSNGREATAITTVTVAPQPVISVSDTLGRIPFKVDFEVSNAIRQYKWIFPDGTSSDLARPTHIFDSVGIHDVLLTAKNLQGLTVRDTVQIRVLPDKSPIATIKTKVISNDSMPLTVEFDGTGSTDDGTIVSYDWNFGDGHVSKGPILSHTFDAEGIYNVKLTVKDDIKQSDDTLTSIKVNSPPQGLPCGGSMTWMERFICTQNNKLPLKRNGKDGWKNWRIPPDSLNLVGILIPDSINASKSIKDLQVALLFFFAKEVLNQERKVYKFQIWLNANQSHTMLQTQRFNINNRIKQSDEISQAQSDAIIQAKIDSVFEYANTVQKYIGPGNLITKYKESTKKVLARLFEQKTIKKEGDILKNKRISTFYTLFDFADFGTAPQEEIKTFLKELEPEEDK
ncbi:PKD repeat-containing protein [Pricia antarctica]|uniref:PKD repeat-containing protein n=1 Tax=Pricia antarctica TaxID=641691 RepID=A0A1G7E6U7_9FLAO|nr:PKD domain-containing protein [Pricia antarctica]SDE59329.1 PKD repeat-containing protein [Pricia antarctica]